MNDEKSEKKIQELKRLDESRKKLSYKKPPPPPPKPEKKDK